MKKPVKAIMTAFRVYFLTAVTTARHAMAAMGNVTADLFSPIHLSR
jgi:hypothetical protein